MFHNVEAIIQSKAHIEHCYISKEWADMVVPCR